MDSTEAAGLTDYARNPFRLSGLPVDASARQIRRRIEELKAADELGADDPRQPGLLASRGSTRETLEALRLLSDPVARLRFEFGWLWPIPGGGLGGTTLDEAQAMWTVMVDGAPEVRAIALHNLAIAGHLSVSEDPHTLRALPSWADSYRRWNEATREEAGWQWLGRRVAAINDPRLTGEHVAAIRDDLAASLVKHHIGTAMAAAGTDTGLLADHVTVMTGTGFSAGTITTAVTAAVAPQVSALRSVLAESQKVKGTPRELRAYAQRLVTEATGTNLGVLRALLPPDHPTASGLIDQLALSIRACTVANANHADTDTAEEYGESVQWLDDALRLPIGPHARTTILEDLATILANQVACIHLEHLAEARRDRGTALARFHELASQVAAPMDRLRSLDHPDMRSIEDNVDFSKVNILMEALFHGGSHADVLRELRTLHSTTRDAPTRRIADKVLTDPRFTSPPAPPSSPSPSAPSPTGDPLDVAGRIIDHRQASCGMCSRPTTRSKIIVLSRRSKGKKEFRAIPFPLCEKDLHKDLSLSGYRSLTRLALLAFTLGVIALPAEWIELPVFWTITAASAIVVAVTIPRRLRRAALYGSPHLLKLTRDGWALRV